MKKLLLFSYFLTIFITAEATDYNFDNFGNIIRMVYSQDGKYIAAFTLGGLIKIYDSTSLDIVREFEGYKISATQLEFSPDGLYIALFNVLESDGRNPQTIFIIEIETGMIISKLVNSDINTTITSISYRFDGKRLVSGSSNGLITIWDPINRIETMKINAPREWIYDISYSKDGNKIISASIKNIKIWDANME
jgi:WD40 repeat protein